MKIDRKYIDDGIISERKHEQFPIAIYNYTQKCQFGRLWDETTLQCRGLILNTETGEIIARPFKKFFNYEECQVLGIEIPNEIPNVYTKVDGSLGILYWFNNEPYIATRGSFYSDQAIWATNFINRPDIRNWLDKLDKNYTHLFEIVYKDNQIVIKYDFEGLIHLASIEIKSGKSIPPDSDFPIVQSIPFTNIEHLSNLNIDNQEGFVLHYPTSDFRCKIKFENYKKLHKILTGLSEIGVWEMLKAGENPISENIPDEMFSWVEDIVNNINSKYSDIETSSKYVFNLVKDLETRKEKAIQIMQYKEIAGVVFAMLDGKDYKEIIFKMIRPLSQRTFKCSDN